MVKKVKRNVGVVLAYVALFALCCGSIWGILILRGEVQSLRKESRSFQQLSDARGDQVSRLGGTPVPGPAGLRGDRGLPGASGASGANGKDGRNGKNGRNGKDGKNATPVPGPSGPAGPPGPVGSPGRDGRDGADGKDGEDGAPGPTCPSGFHPQEGTDPVTGKKSIVCVEN
jgi:hypothetical protein